MRFWGGESISPKDLREIDRAWEERFGMRIPPEIDKP